jgi:hypothetical protein
MVLASKRWCGKPRLRRCAVECMRHCAVHAGVHIWQCAGQVDGMHAGDVVQCMLVALLRCMPKGLPSWADLWLTACIACHGPCNRVGSVCCLPACMCVAQCGAHRRHGAVRAGMWHGAASRVRMCAASCTACMLHPVQCMLVALCAVTLHHMLVVVGCQAGDHGPKRG